jgi:hypothetical protein
LMEMDAVLTMRFAKQNALQAFIVARLNVG